MVKVSQEQVREVQTARWEGFKRLAKHLKDHHILAVDMIRTSNDETAAVFTVVKHHEPVQYLVRGDAQGRVKETHCEPRDAAAGAAPRAMELKAMAGEDVPITDDMALGGPPPKQDPPPGIVAIGSVLLAGAFNAAEHTS